MADRIGTGPGMARALEERAAAVVRDRWRETDPTVLALVRLLVRAGELGHAGLDLSRSAEELAELLDLEGAERLPAAPDDMLAALRRSAAVTAGPVPEVPPDGAAVRPLVLTGDLLQTERAHRFEQRIVAALRRRRDRTDLGIDPDDVTVRATALLDRLDAALGGPDGPPPLEGEGFRVSGEQRGAIRRLLTAGTRMRVAILSGGPGTGKTTTVATLLGLLGAAAGSPLRIALAAPTGRARSRLVESIRGQGVSLARTLGLLLPEQRADEVRDDVLGVRAATVHGLLGIGRDGVARRTAGSLPYDVIVVDETSMLDLPLAADLLDAARDDALVVLVGDPHQLESVGTGSVLHSLIGGLRADPSGAPIGVLEENRRSSQTQDEAGRADGLRRDAIVTAIRGYGRDPDRDLDRDLDDLIALLRSPSPLDEPAIGWIPVEDGEDPAVQRARIVGPLVRPLREARRLVASDAGPASMAAVAEALERLGSVRLLCAHRSGRWGVATWNRIVRAAVDGENDAAAVDASAARSDPRSGWRLGEPVIMTVNDPLTRLSNGDVGIVAGVRPAVLAFPRPPAPDAGRGTEDAAAGGLLLQPAVGLPEVRSAHAITVHRAQGSEYAEVVVIMPPSDSRLATRELLYTALTRAKRRVLLVASEEALRAAVRRSSSRMGGLERAVAALVGTG